MDLEGLSELERSETFAHLREKLRGDVLMEEEVERGCVDYLNLYLDARPRAACKIYE